MVYEEVIQPSKPTLDVFGGQFYVRSILDHFFDGLCGDWSCSLLLFVTRCQRETVSQRRKILGIRFAKVWSEVVGLLVADMHLAS